MPAGPYPTQQMFEALEARVGGAPLLSDSVGPDLTQQISVVPQTQGVWLLYVRSIPQLSGSVDTQFLSELRVQVPAGTTQIPAGLVVSLGPSGAPVVPLAGAPTLIDANGARWLSLPVRTTLSQDAPMVRVDFGEAYPVVVSDQVGDANPDLSTEATATQNGNVLGVGVGVHLDLTSPRSVFGRLSPDAWPVVAQPSVLPNRGAEIVLASPPYLRLMLDGQEWQLTFTAAEGGGSAT